MVVGLQEDQQCPENKRSFTITLDKRWLISENGRNLALSVKRKLQEFGSSESSAVLEFVYMPSSQIPESHSFLINSLKYPEKLELNFHCNLSIHRIKFWIWFLEISILWLQKIKVTLRAIIEAFWFLTKTLSHEFKTLTPFSPSTSSSIFRNNQINPS